MNMETNEDGNAELEIRLTEIHAPYAAGFQTAEEQEVGAIYLRTGVQGNDPLYNQLLHTLELAKRDNIWVPREHLFWDRGPSGVTLRPGFVALRQLLETERVKTVIMLSFSRLHRLKSELDSFVEHCQAFHNVHFLVADEESDSATIGRRRAHIDQEQAAIVREVFGQHSSGMAMDEIASDHNP